ncbi:MAG: type II secretion system major pseudopilin GspG [Candidatus Hydrogenedentes bacterium]|nr:type II secretion system major pseudopilin GspG [Candidatus Hydrogenedentota bacterium]
MNADVRNERRRSAAGFTLIELMVVISIIAVLATIVGYNVIGAMDDASVAQAKSQIRSFKTALLAYRLKFNRFPTTSEGLGALIENDKGIKFLDNTIPKDPWSNDYVYSSDSARDYRVMSYGADGRPGGSGYDEDIDSGGTGTK